MDHNMCCKTVMTLNPGIFLKPSARFSTDAILLTCHPFTVCVFLWQVHRWHKLTQPVFTPLAITEQCIWLSETRHADIKFFYNTLQSYSKFLYKVVQIDSRNYQTTIRPFISTISSQIHLSRIRPHSCLASLAKWISKHLKSNSP